MDVMESGKDQFSNQPPQLNKSYDFRQNLGGIKQKNIKIDMNMADMDETED